MKVAVKVTALLFAIGAVSGTALSFELGLLWPRFMELAGGPGRLGVDAAGATGHHGGAFGQAADVLRHPPERGIVAAADDGEAAQPAAAPLSRKVR